MSKLRTWLAREDWVAACEFDPSPESDVLTRIKDKIKENKELGAKSYVLLDLDSTLYEVAPRTVKILREAAEVLKDVPDAVRRALVQLKEHSAGYSLEDTWRNLGLCLKNPQFAEARECLHDFWRQRFFSNTYLELDKPYPGTPSFAQQLHQMGAELVYLTGRDEPRMREGTLSNLQRDGFPIGLPGTQLRMKAGADEDDVEHKTRIAQQLLESGEVVASFENEPRNFVALFQTLPGAIHVFVDTVCSDKPAPVVRGAYRLRQFRA